MSLDHINIRPGVSMLSILPYLPYKPWFALAEFVDNSLQSYLSNKDRLSEIEGESLQLRVDIGIDTIEPACITIRDNAAGIAEAEYSRAFRPAELPIDRSGLSEFGMGMKSAACWFSPKWLVRTSALGESLERQVELNIKHIVEDRIEELQVISKPAPANEHFTEVILLCLYKPPRTKTLAKIREHLTSIYRKFTREGVLDLRVNGEPLIYEEPRVLVAPFHGDKGSGNILWRKEINFDLGKGLSVHGFAAIRERGSTKTAGFALFRRGRLIQGSADEGYRPDSIFGSPNSYIYQRLIGELHLEGFEVSHTKDGIRWADDEETFLDLLKEHLDASPLPLLDQAENYRVRPRLEEVRLGAETATIRTAGVVAREVPAVIERLKEKVESFDTPERLAEAPITSRHEVEVTYKQEIWRVAISLSNDLAVGNWLEIADQGGSNTGKAARVLELRMSLSHPFTLHFGGLDARQIEPLLRVAIAFALGEVIATDSGVRYARMVRDNANALLRDALWKP